MRWNPCGAVVDLRRAPFEFTIPVFRNSAETVCIVWYEALPQARTLPFPSHITVPDWDGEGYTYDEDFDFNEAPRTFQPWGGHPGAFGLHQCGNETDFGQGGLYLPNLPLVKIGTNGLPACCNVAIVPEIDAGGQPRSRMHTFPLLPPVADSGARPDSPVTLYPPGPASGDDCTSAPTVPHGAEVDGVWSVGSDAWYQFNITSAGAYTITLIGATDANVTINGWTGVCPLGLGPVPLFHVVGTQTWNFVAGGAMTLWIEVKGIFGSGTFGLILTP